MSLIGANCAIQASESAIQAPEGAIQAKVTAFGLGRCSTDP